MQTEKELEIHRKLEDLEENAYQYEKTERQLDSLEDDMLWGNQHGRELNNDLFTCYSQDRNLGQILTRGEELLDRQVSLERVLLQECRENLDEMKRNAKRQKDDCFEELERMSREAAGEKD